MWFVNNSTFLYDNPIFNPFDVHMLTVTMWLVPPCPFLLSTTHIFAFATTRIFAVIFASLHLLQFIFEYMTLMR